MKKKKLTLEKFKVAKLQQLTKISGGGGMILPMLRTA